MSPLIFNSPPKNNSVASTDPSITAIQFESDISNVQSALLLLPNVTDPPPDFKSTVHDCCFPFAFFKANSYTPSNSFTSSGNSLIPFCNSILIYFYYLQILLNLRNHQLLPFFLINNNWIKKKNFV
jgi:hypothetical protein